MSRTTATNLIHVFVYGTLKRNQPNHFWLTNIENGYAKFMSEGKTKVKFPLVVGTRYNIPFLLNKPDFGNQIEGEIYEIDDSMLKNLDILEDYPKYYGREIQEIETNDGHFIPCWLYLIKKFPAAMLEKKFLTSYEDSVEEPYCERSKRDPTILALNDLDF